MEAMPREAKFSISLVGETSGASFSGVFKVKNRLTHKEQLSRDEIRRSILGPNGEQASLRAQNQALIFSELQAHIIESPKFWQLLDNGLDAEDDNLVREVYDNLQRVILEFRVAMEKQLNKDKVAVVDLAPKADPIDVQPITTTKAA